MGVHKKPIKRTCEACEKVFYVRQYDVNRGGGRYCSKSCAARTAMQGRFGSNNPHYKGGISKHPYHYKKRSIARYPERDAARRAVRRAIKNGLLDRQSCEKCGATEKIHAHHEDYSKPLDIIWLCPPCHRLRHKTMKEQSNAITTWLETT